MHDSRPTLFAILTAALAVPAAAQSEAQASVAVPVAPDLAAAIRAEGLERSQVMQFQEELCHNIGARLTGSDAFTLACDWALDRFAEMGLAARLDGWAEWQLVWNRGQWSGRVLEPEAFDLQVATPAWTAPTRGQVAGRLWPMPSTSAALEEYEALDDAVYLWGPRPEGEENEALREALDAALAARPPLGLVQSARSTGRTDERYSDQIRVFGNSITARGSWDKRPTVPEIIVRDDQAARIDGLLAAGPVRVQFEIRNRFRPGPIALHNVIADLVGTEKPDEMVIVCGHLDSWHQATGATDNGTGVCSTMEAARILAAVGARPKRTIRFVLWGGEEQGLLGSAAYVRRNRADMKNVSAVLNHDTGTNWANSLSVTHAMRPLFEAVLAPVQELAPPQEGHEGPTFTLRSAPTMSGGFGGSDHASFLSAGVPAWSWGLTGVNEYGYGWHSQWDTFDIVIPEYQRHTATVVALTALGLANLDELLPREGVRRTGGGLASYFREWFGWSVDDRDGAIVVTEVVAEGPAAAAGVEVGDVLLEVWGQEIGSEIDLYRAYRRRQADAPLALRCRRGEAELELVAAGDSGGDGVPRPR